MIIIIVILIVLLGICYTKYSGLKQNQLSLEQDILDLEEAKLKIVKECDLKVETFNNHMRSKIDEVKKYEDYIKKTVDQKIEVYESEEFSKVDLSLNNFINDYLSDNYIERRDEVLLEQLEYTPIEYRYQLSGEYKQKMTQYDTREKEIIKLNQYVTGSIFNKKSDETKFEKMIVSSFNCLCDNVINKVSVKNYAQQEKKLTVLFNQFNQALQLGSNHTSSTMQIGKRIIELKFKKLSLMLEYKLKVEEEKELLKEQRQQAKEEKKLQDILDKQIQKIEDEKLKINKQKEVYLARLENEASMEIKQAIVVEIEKLNVIVETLDGDEKTLEQKRKFTSCGYVYIISNIGSFGENVYKIGMTRREEPMDRVKELGDASVPFLFDVHALIYSTNAYELENQLHKHFASRRVNKINIRKEFFNVTLDEIKQVVLQNFNGTVDFISTPEAIEYRETLLVNKN